MAADPFNSAGGYTYNIPPVPLIDTAGSLTVVNANVANSITVGNITATGTVIATTFVGNVQGGFTVEGPDTGILFNNAGSADAIATVTYTSQTDTVTVAGNLIANSFTIGANNNEFSTSRVVFATTSSSGVNQQLHSIPASTISSIEYMVIATDAISNTRQTSKLIASVLGSEVGYYEYGTIDMNGGVGDFKVNYDSGAITFTVTPITANPTQYKIMITSYKEGL
jgi:hypothetical protein